MSELYCAQFLQLFFPELNFPYGDRVFTTYLFYYLAGCYVGQRYDEFVAALRKTGASSVPPSRSPPRSTCR